MKQKIIKAGPFSLAVVIPAVFIHALGINKGDTVIVETDSIKGIVKMRFKGSLLQLSLPESKIKKKSHPQKN
ncbi:hypothetical protein A3D78_01895 [Candidatus Gottesmanbacteria bacterium RIFCSPHIGHO2_02_FULL_39_14]|uniref:SpoVT-AbrB domain-containing protein n=3 Tax=Candidatus Gottesmaniibacteriota TaxID=1752720 RepID=A0A1F6A1J6_9BACT|nr:MAG: hypothetical protein A2153_03180 [Candidatus Gottesmanbacteria bacterium RBG_16_38_7b]OGG18548.1 MAG: hypothetical protein A3D78_01895 [Candidatus Gottesmanbacteria bacterium RIFCSPHIGHO2_02_FULL_39_14]OGG31545.1 MAG: hypothetical protein A3I51_04685 [Candidatus Gottesmanbacteria bacterium RIFCSPLOWO2_02_FULL_38_8]